jgi:magnesium chelatase subunit H
MRDNVDHSAYRFVILTLDSHSAGPAMRASDKLTAAFPGLDITIHAAAEWGENPAALIDAKQSIATANIIVTNLLFLEAHTAAILPDLIARRAGCDAMINIIADSDIVKLTKMGDLDMSKPASGLMGLLKRLKPTAKASKSGESQMKTLRRLPKILRLIPGKSQDLRNWFLSMQYWLGGSDDNIEQMIRMLVSRYAVGQSWKPMKAKPPIEYPEVGVYHPDLSGQHISTDAADLPRPENAVATIGMLMLRSYILSSDTAHYDAVIRAFEEKGMAVIPAFAGGLDGTPAIENYFQGNVDAMVSLTGFSLVGGPAYNDSAAAVKLLTNLDVPYIAAQPLEFQTLGQWAESPQGLGPIETTMLVALPEIDGATNPTVFAGRHGPEGCRGCAKGCVGQSDCKAMAPCHERITSLAEKTLRLAKLRRKQNADKKIGVVLFGFPPNAGAVGTAAYLSVFESLFNTLNQMKADGYTVDVPESVDHLRAMILQGNAAQYGQQANVGAHVDVDTIVRTTPPLKEIEAVWGPAPGKVQSDGRGVFILGQHFGNVFVGVQPTFGYEGDPMRLLFERGFAPTHAFVTFYMWLRNTFNADAILHFGMHGALEFMPGKQSGLGARDWPDRLIGEMPNIYLYAANNPSEASLAKRRSNAVIITHLTPPLASSGLYKGLAEVRDSLKRWRELPDADSQRSELEVLIRDQAAAVDMDASNLDQLWLRLLETEGSLIPDGFHIVGKKMSDTDRNNMLDLMDHADAAARAHTDTLLQNETELRGLMNALSAHYIPPAMVAI